MRAVVVAREAVALRGCMQIVQMCGDLGGRVLDVIIRKMIVHTVEEWLAVACEDRGARGGDFRGGARGGGFRGGARETPDGLWRIRWIEDPTGVLLSRHLIEDGCATAEPAELTEALVRCPSTFTSVEIRCFSRGRIE